MGDCARHTKNGPTTGRMEGLACVMGFLCIGGMNGWEGGDNTMGGRVWCEEGGFVVCMRPHSVMASGSDERKYNPLFNYGGFESILIAVSQYNTIVKYLRVKCLNTSPSRSFAE